jgi:hypothetical protein
VGQNRELSRFPNAITALDNGNVGIGTSSPSYKLDVTGTGKVSSTLLVGGNINQNINDGGLNLYKADGTTLKVSLGNVDGSNTDEGLLALFKTNVQKVQLRANGVSYFNGGNVGIGTSSPVLTGSNRTTLDISGVSQSLLVLSTGSSWKSYFYNDGTNLSIANSGGFINFDISGERMRIANTGNVGIGTSSPGSKLHLYDGANPLSLKIQRTSVPVYLSDVQPAGTTAAAAWTHNMESTSNGSVSWGGFANGSYAGSAIMLNANTGSSYITFHTAPSANTNPSERFRIDGTNGYTNTYKSIGNIASTSLASLSDAQTQRWYFTSQCNNTWRALVANINFRSFVVRMWGSDAGTSNYGEHYFTMSFPGYGVSNNANLHYVSGGWNTGGYELSYTNNGGAYYLIFRNTSYYDSNNVATYYMEIISV